MQKRIDAVWRGRSDVCSTSSACAVAVLALVVVAGLSHSVARADPQPQVEGLGPDAQLAGGVGLGLDGRLRNPFLGRARFGALYAFQSFIANAGISLEVGALGKVGVGCELELNAGRGLFIDLGLGRVSDKRWMTHLTLGYTVFGLEWQHDFDDKTPSNALLLEVRFPLGIWWRVIGRRDATPVAPEATTNDPRIVRRPAPPLAIIKPTPPSAAAPANAPGTAPPSSSQTSANDPTPAERAQIAQALAEADRATERGDHAAATAALQRAYMLHVEPSLLPRLARAELAQGRLLLAMQDLKRFLAGEAEDDERADAARELANIERRLAHVRLELSRVAGDEQITIDGAPEPEAILGYDVALDPGEHTLVLSRATRPPLQRSFQAHEGELVRLVLDLSQP